MALTTDRMSVLRGRPPVRAGGRKGFKIAHCWSVRSLGYGFGFIPFLRSTPPFGTDSETQKSDEPDDEKTLAGFIENFCASQPKHLDTYRETMTQPYVYWTLEAPFATIIGLYSNVDGSLDGRGTNEQQRWFEGQMRSAPADKCLIVAVHHPPYSLDSDHGGSPAILAALERASRVSGRWPDAVFSGHAHNYQRFTREVNGHQIPFVVAGAGGYANNRKLMHQIQLDADGLPVPAGKPFQTTVEGVVLEFYEDTNPGFLRLTVDAETLTGEYFTVPFDDAPPAHPVDSFRLNWKTHRRDVNSAAGTHGGSKSKPKKPGHGNPEHHPK